MSAAKREPAGVVVRSLKPDDLEAVIGVDERITGRRREEFFRLKLGQALSDTGVVISLGAELDGRLVGFALARVYYGEFGVVERVAVLDTLGVRPDLRGRGVGAALLGQLCTNLGGLGISRVQTEVDWDGQELLAFFHRAGFRPAPRLCLELDVESWRAAAEKREGESAP